MAGRPKTVSLSGGAPSTSDDALALEFAEANESYVRLSLATGHWMIWDGSRWRSDRCTVRESIRRTCRNAAAAASDSAGAVRIASAAKVMAVEALARSDARLMVDDERWDANPWLLNTPSGAVDLVTGEIHTHDPDLLMTRMAAASAEGLAPRWRDSWTASRTETLTCRATCSALPVIA
ncbi:hypothetical protein [Mesorhizobium sp. M1312]|uniref:hypothetical protein n=1 Tax=unclassified Mesorhizobium TaxID=325217 RepID=UPI0033391FFD